jgi:hypothetical protein
MIIRRRHNGKFTVIGNAPMDDDRLSADALGVLCYLRSRPDNWQVIPEQLCKRFDCGRHKIYRILRFLVETGYIQRHQYRDVANNTFSRTTYVVYDEPPEPCAENQHTGPRVENQHAGEPCVDFRHADEPHAEKPYTENRHALIKTDRQQRLKGTKTKKKQKGPTRKGIVTRDSLYEAQRGLS